MFFSACNHSSCFVGKSVGKCLCLAFPEDLCREEVKRSKGQRGEDEQRGEDG